jgi:hypothetical protein
MPGSPRYQLDSNVTLASSGPRDISSVIISGGSSGWHSFGARWCVLVTRERLVPTDDPA